MNTLLRNNVHDRDIVLPTHAEAQAGDVEKWMYCADIVYHNIPYYANKNSGRVITPCRVLFVSFSACSTIGMGSMVGAEQIDLTKPCVHVAVPAMLLVILVHLV